MVFNTLSGDSQVQHYFQNNPKTSFAFSQCWNLLWWCKSGVSNKYWWLLSMEQDHGNQVVLCTLSLFYWFLCFQNKNKNQFHPRMFLINQNLPIKSNCNPWAFKFLGWYHGKYTPGFLLHFESRNALPEVFDSQAEFVTCLLGQHFYLKGGLCQTLTVVIQSWVPGR